MGPQLSVNQTTIYNQYTPSVGMDAANDFVIGWSSEFQDGFANGVFARTYAADGTPTVDHDIQVNAGWSNDEIMDFYGLGVAPDGSFAADGTPMTGDLPVNTYTAGLQAYGSVAVAPDGGFLVTWVSLGQDGSGQGVYAQEFTSEGTRVGEEIRVNERTSLDQVQARVAADGNGNFVTVFTSEGTDGSGLGIVGQRLGGYSTQLLDSSTTTITTVNQGVHETLTVTGTVTAGAPGYEDLYFWRYHVENQNYSQFAPYGATIFELNLSPGGTDGISNVKNSLGWGYQIGVPTGVNIIRWSGQPALGPGGRADFAFTTPVAAIGFADAAIEEMFGAAGQVPGPARPWVNLTAYRPNTSPYNFATYPVPESTEQSQGAGIRFNGDDDDNDGIREWHSVKP